MRTLALACVFVFGGVAAASSLSGTISVDNEFSLYLSTNDSQLGNLVTSSTNWTSPTSFNVSLTPGTTYFLHVVGFNDGGPDMFVGSFNLSDTNFSFSNGTQALDTNTTDFKGNLTGFGNTYSTPLDFGPSGTSPWGSLAGINSTAHFIWMDPNENVNLNNYFTTKITSSAVPEPATCAALAIGALGLLARRRPRNR